MVELNVVFLIVKNYKVGYKNVDLLAKNFIIFSLCILLILPVTVKGISPKEDLSVSEQETGKSNPCKCVVFRLDDVRDKYFDPVQIKIMNLFLSKEAPLTLGLVMQSIGKDTSILNKISEGYEKGLFELALHGWEHKNYTELSQQEQKHSLYKANERFRIIFGNKSEVFIPPHNKFNNDTVTVIKELGIKILSSSIPVQDKFDQGRSIFNSSTKKQNANQSQGIYFLPHSPELKKFVGQAQIKVPMNEVVNDINDSIDKYGYAVVLMHPQSFIKLDKTGKYTDVVKENINRAEINYKDMNDLEYLIDHIKQKGIEISSFHKILNDTIS